MSLYPDNTPTDADLYQVVDNFGTSLNGAIDDTQTTITLTNVIGLPAVGILTIESEKIKYTGISGNDITGVTRGFSSTTAASHANGTAAWFNIVEEHHNALKDEVIAIATDNRSTFSADLDDSVTPAATADSLKERLDHVVTQLKNITGEADWKDAPDNTIAAIESDVNDLQTDKKDISTGNAYKFETTDASGDLQETTVTPSRAVVTDANGLPAASATTATEIGHVSGVTSGIQGQLNAKAADSAVVHNTGNETVAGVKTFSDGIASPSINGSGVWGFRNRIINGDMRIDQRMAGGVTTVNSTVLTFSLDRWGGQGTGTDGVFTFQQSTDAPSGFTHSLKTEVTTADASITAGNTYLIQHRVEGTFFKDSLWGSANAKTVTLSFWCRSSVTGTFSGALRNSGASRSYIFEYTINSADTWEKKTVTILGETSGTWLTDTGNGLSIVWDLGCGSNFQSTAGSWLTTNSISTAAGVKLISTLNATLYLTGVQLELGSAATEFEFRPDAVELALCQRYYQKTFAQGVAVEQNAGVLGAITYRTQAAGASPSGSTWSLPVVMRATPTTVFYNPNAANSLWRNTSLVTDSGTASASATVSDRVVNIFNTQVVGDAVSHTLSIQATASAEL